MSSFFHHAARGLLVGTGLQYWPVRARNGYNAGARWTLYPWTSYWRGTHEPAVGNALDSVGDLRGKTCWDLGAHYGYYACGFAQRVGPTGHVLAIEPFPSNFARLERHRRANGFTWMRCVAAAASDRAGEADLFASLIDGDTGVHLAYDENESKQSDVPKLRVATVRADDLVQRGDTRAPDLVKIDVEGHAHFALLGAIESIRHARPIIVIALHSRIESAGAHALLDPLGYRWESLQPEHAAIDSGDFIVRPS